MTHESIKAAFSDAVNHVASNISLYAVDPYRDFVRNHKSAKLKPEALEAVFHQFNSSVPAIDEAIGYRFLAAGGSTFTFFSKPSFSYPEYSVSEEHSAKGFYSMHLNDFYDLQKHTYTNTLLQPVHHKDEFRVLCDMVDRHIKLPDTRDVFNWRQRLLLL